MNKLDCEILKMTFQGMMDFYPISAPNITSILNKRGIDISLYAVRKSLNKWREKGFVKVYKYKIYDEYENMPPMKGWSMCKDNSIYNYLSDRDERIAKECFSID